MKRIRQRMLGPEEIIVEDPFIQNSFELERAYLLRLKPQRLLAGFYETAGLEPEAPRYKGWESSEIAGHTMGHYLTALSQAWACTGDEKFLEKTRACVEGLARCQRGDGYVFASPEEIFDRVEQKQPAWVPWYTMHKILSGLISVCRYVHDAAALNVAVKLGGWISRRVLAWSEETKAIVLAVEYGGMNDCLYDLYDLTGDETFFKAAHQFDEIPLFKAMEENRDILNGLHANTTIPKIIGALKRYVVSDETDDLYITAAKNFWDMVTGHHTYITGGNSEWEHFGRPDVLDAERTACNCETCNTYNMLKLSRLLFAVTGEKKYADYDEQAYTNAILSSQNHKTGMTTYFQPMATGYFKVYSRPEDQFWCCTGTGMENFSKPWAGIAFAGEDMLWLNRFENARILWKEGGMDLELCADFLTSDDVVVKILKSGGAERAIAVRIPAWAATWNVQGETPVPVKEANGYLIFKGCWSEGMSIKLSFGRTLTVHSLPDSDNTAAFVYGPFVLSSDLGTHDLKTTSTGVDVTVPESDDHADDCLLLEGSNDAFEESLNRMAPDGKGRFEFTGADEKKVVFSPHFLKDQERYGIYYRLFKAGSEELERYCQASGRRRKLLESQSEVIPLGNDQYELASRIHGEHTDSTTKSGHRGRMAEIGGWFSYEMQIPDHASVLHMTLEKGVLAGFDVEFRGDETTYTYPAQKALIWDEDDGEFSHWHMKIPGDLQKSVVRVEFSNRCGKAPMELFDEVYISREDDNE